MFVTKAYASGGSGSTSRKDPLKYTRDGRTHAEVRAEARQRGQGRRVTRLPSASRMGTYLRIG